MRLATLLSCLFLSTSLLGQIPSYVPTDGLVAFYPFNGNAEDESGFGNTGSVSGASITSDRNGNQSAFYFNGNGDQVNIPYSSSLSPTAEVSVAAWCRAETFEGKNLVANGTHVNFYDRSYYLFGPDANGQCRFRLHAGTTEESIFTNTTFELSQWIHLVGTYDGFAMRIYANGTLEGELLKSGAINQHGNGTTIGSNIFYAFSDYWFQGDIDDVGIWNRALTDTEIASLFAEESAADLQGCTDASACNYDASATEDDGSCLHFDGVTLEFEYLTDSVHLVAEHETWEDLVLPSGLQFFGSYGNHLYLNTTEVNSWSNNRTLCEGASGQLTSIQNENENRFVTSILEEHAVTTGGGHLGASDAENEGDWQWIDGTPWTYTNWSGVEPGNSWGGEHYGQMYTSGFWNDCRDNSGPDAFIAVCKRTISHRLSWSQPGSGSILGLSAPLPQTVDLILETELGSCIQSVSIDVNDQIFGCTDATACNYDANATEDDGNCTSSGCMEEDACNYDPTAQCVGEVCDYSCCPGPGCCDEPSQWDNALQQCNTATPDTIFVTDTLLVPTPFCGAGTHWDPVTEMCIADVPGTTDENCTVMNLQELAEGYQVLLDHTADQDSIILAQQATIDALDAVCGCSAPVSYQGHDYEVVEIGGQCWFAENLQSESYRNGDAIPVLSNGDWDDTPNGSQAAFDGNEANVIEYGRLFNWHAIDDSRRLCPSGWHVPDDAEWQVLIDGIGEQGGLQLKASSGWTAGPNGTDAFGFDGRPAGYRSANGVFSSLGALATWWSATPNENGGDAHVRSLIDNSDEVYLQQGISRQQGRSIRCLKN